MRRKKKQRPTGASRKPTSTRVYTARAVVAYRVGAPNGEVQLLRTGVGFWRPDHAAPFSVDRACLELVVKNTQLRGRPLRVNLMHWPLLGDGPSHGVEDYRAAGWIDPAHLRVQPWTAEDGEQGYGIFAVISWTPEAHELIRTKKLTQFSPEIAWDYVLQQSRGGVAAGTRVGPTLVGGALCDLGFFWMNDVTAYRAQPLGTRLYKEQKMKLAPEKIQAMIQALTDEGFSEEEIAGILEATMSAPAAEPAAPAEPALDAATAEPTLGLMAARFPVLRSLLSPAQQGTQAPARGQQNVQASRTPQAAAPAPAQPAPGAPVQSPAPGSVLSELQRVLLAPAPTPNLQTAQPTGYSAQLEELTRGMSELSEVVSLLVYRAAEQDGRHAGFDQQTSLRLFREAPQLYADLVAGRSSLRSGASPQGAAAQQRRGLSFQQQQTQAAGEDDDQQFARRVSAYRDSQAKAGRRLTQAQAIEEVVSAERNAKLR